MSIAIPSGLREPRGLRARLKGTHFATVTAGQTANLDWQIEQLQWEGTNKDSFFDGVEYYAKNGEIGDKIKFQVVDVDGLVSPPGTVIEEFGDVYAMPNSPTDIILYKGKLVPGLYARLVYVSTGGQDVVIVCNMFRHLNEA